MGENKQPPEDQGTLTLQFNKINPKPNAPSYNIETIEQLFNILTDENIDRFLKEFNDGIKAAYDMRKAVLSVAEAAGQEVSPADLTLKSFVWTDD